MNIGNQLSSARKSKGLEVKDIEEALKIRARFVKALENNEFDVIPGPVYVKGFIRSYATYLNIDSQPLVDNYKKLQPPEPSATMVEPVPPSLSLEPKQKVIKRYFTVPAAVLTIIFVMTIFLAYLGYQDSLQSQKLAGKKYADKDLEDLKDTKKKNKKKKKKGKPVADDDIFRIKVVAQRGTWLRVRAKNKTFYYNYLRSGKSEDFISREPLEVTAGRGSYLQVYQSDKYKGTIGDSPTVSTKVFQNPRVKKDR